MIQSIAYGLTIGGILYITSVGLSLTFGAMRIVNYAHGIIYTIGAYGLVTALPMLRENFFAAAIVAVLISIPIAWAIERYIISRLYGVSSDYAIIATYALCYVGVDLIKWVWGTNPIALSDPIGKIINIFTVDLPLYRLLIIILSILIFVGLDQFFKRNTIGKIVVAGLEDREAVRSLGIDVNKYFTFVFILGSCLAALGGVLYAPITSVHPYMGFSVLRLSFAVIIVGGLGKLRGTFYSAIFLGLVMGITGRFWGPAAEAMVFVVMAITLALRPEIEN